MDDKNTSESWTARDEEQYMWYLGTMDALKAASDHRHAHRKAVAPEPATKRLTSRLRRIFQANDYWGR